MDRLEILEIRKKIIEFLRDDDLPSKKYISDHSFCRKLNLSEYRASCGKTHPLADEIIKLRPKGYNELEYMLPELLRAKLEIDEKFYIMPSNAVYWFHPENHKDRIKCCGRALQIIQEEIDSLKPSGTLMAVEVNFTKTERKQNVDIGCDVTRGWEDEMPITYPLPSKQMDIHFEVIITNNGPLRGKITNEIIENKILELLQEIKL